MAYYAYVTALKNVRPHPNADRMKLADCFSNTVCVGLDAKEGDIGLYLPTDGQVSIEFGEYNNLLRKKDDAGNSIGGYLDPDKRNIKAIKLRGEKSDGLFLGLECLEYTGVDISTLTIGSMFTSVNGHEICKKYVPRTNHKSSSGSKSNKIRKKKDPVAPLFAEHADTEQLAYNLNQFKPGDEIEVTLKIHGTSQRTAHLPVLIGYEDSEVALARNAITRWLNKHFNKHIEDWHDGEPIYDWGYVSGTRRTVLENYEGGYYGSNEFREEWSKLFEGKLHKGETVYYEVAGFTQTGTPIMAEVSNSKVNDKAFAKRYGKTTIFSYGCSSPHCDMWVYRMTITNEDGDVFEYSPELVRYRCEQMGVKSVPLLASARINYDGTLTWWNEIGEEDMGLICIGEEVDNDPYNFQYNAGEGVLTLAEKFYDGPDLIDDSHIREGVVVRITNRPKFTAYKHKNFYFKVLEGIAKDVAEVPDMEEADGELAE